ncbi:MAG: YncE family protein, partial [Fibrobacter sp.]|nr:YncE family protein [Fibrobacter sp.]
MLYKYGDKIMRRYLIFLFTIAICCLAYSASDPVKTVSPGLLFELLALNGDLETVQKPKYLSPAFMAVSTDQKTIYICEQTAKQVDFYSVETNAVFASVKMPNEPTGIAVSPTEDNIYVTCSSERWPGGIVCIVNVTAKTIEKRISVGHMARSPIIAPDGKMLYVCNWLENTISFIDLNMKAETKRVSAIKEPYSSVLSSTGKHLLVANMIPDGVSTDTSMACKVCFINTSTGAIDKIIKLPDGSHSTMNICISPDKKYAFIPHLIGRVNLPATTLEQ